MNSAQVREAFKAKLGVRTEKGWDQITSSDIHMLAGYIAKELETHESDCPNASYEIGKIYIRKSKKHY